MNLKRVKLASYLAIAVLCANLFSDAAVAKRTSAKERLNAGSQVKASHSSTVLIEKASKFESQGKYPEALECYQYLLDLSQASLAKDQKDQTDLVALKLKCRCLVCLANIELQTSSFAKSRDYAESGLATSKNAISESLDNNSKAELLTRQGQALSVMGSVHSRTAHYDQAQADFKDSVEVFDSVLKLDPGCMEALNSKAIVLGRRGVLEGYLGQYDLACKSFEQSRDLNITALSLDPDNAALKRRQIFILQKLGNIYLGLWKNEAASRLLLQAEEMAKHLRHRDQLENLECRASVLEFRSVLELRQEHFEEGLIPLSQGLVLCNRVLKVLPSSLPLLNLKALILSRQAALFSIQRQYKEAIQIGRDAVAASASGLKSCSDDLVAMRQMVGDLLRLARYLKYDKQPDRAQELLQQAFDRNARAMEIAPGNIQSYCLQSDLLATRSYVIPEFDRQLEDEIVDCNLARAELDKALRSAPSSLEVFRNMSCVSLNSVFSNIRLKRYQTAIALCEESIQACDKVAELAPLDVGNYGMKVSWLLLQADCYHLSGNYSEAQEKNRAAVGSIDKALAVDPYRKSLIEIKIAVYDRLSSGRYLFPVHAKDHKVNP